MPPLAARAKGSSAAAWVFLLLLLVAGGGGAYYYFVYRPAHMAPPVGRLTVSGNVSGAKIVLDGRSNPSWVTPYTFPKVTTGPHTVVISKEGYEDLRQILDITEGGTNTITANLVERAPPPDVTTAMVTITSNVPGANITVDDLTHPVWITPYTFAAFPVGEHTVELSKGGYQNAKQTKAGAQSSSTLTSKRSRGDRPHPCLRLRSSGSWRLPRAFPAPPSTWTVSTKPSG